jgi:hypothetical protein
MFLSRSLPLIHLSQDSSRFLDGFQKQHRDCSVHCNQNILCDSCTNNKQIMWIAVLVKVCRNYIAIAPSTCEQQIVGVHT